MENLCTIYAIERKWKSDLISYDDLKIIDAAENRQMPLSVFSMFLE